MTKIRHTVQPDQNIIEALRKIHSPVYDRKHNLYVYFNDDVVKKGETRFEHIAKRYHELKVRDINCLADGIHRYVMYRKSKEHKDTFYYFINRKGMDKGFIQLAIKLIEGETNKYYVKTIFITYRLML